MCMLYLFYQLPNYNLFTQHVIYLYGETHLVNYVPWSILLHSYYHYFHSSNIYFLANKYLLPHDTLNPLFWANRWDWQPHYKLGQSIWVVLCAGSTLSIGTTQGAVQSQLSTTFRNCFFFVPINKLWFHNWGKTYCYALHTLLLGFPTGSST
jgi:hypothetical protein